MAIEPEPFQLDQLVENRRAFTTETAELNLYDTYQPAEGIALRFSSPLLVSMLAGRKVMQVGDQRPFDFLPGQSLVMPARENMRIDFPEARLDTPTRCLALALSPDLIRETTDLFNEKHPRLDEACWELDDRNYYLSPDPELHQVVHQLIGAFQERSQLREPLTKLKLQELLVRLMQTQARNLLLASEDGLETRSRLAAVMAYIRRHLHEDIPIEKLARLACMSRRQFYRAFRQELGLSPNRFINQERIKRARALLQSGSSVKMAAYEAGFNSIQHFGRLFKKSMGMTPSAYSQSVR